MAIIQSLSAREILDSRGRPTVEAMCTLECGASAAASVPSGASTGAAEALELRDGDAQRYGGLGCRKAVANVNSAICKALQGKTFDEQSALDVALLDLDGTANKSSLGANAILAVSLAFARACAKEQGVPLYRHFAAIAGRSVSHLPRMTINLFSGGKHAGGQVPIQDVLIVPTSAATTDDGLAMTYAVYYAAAKLQQQRFGVRTLRADEGGLAPPVDSAEQLIELAVDAISAAGFAPGEDVTIALDVASSHFFENKHYHLGGEPLDAPGMIATIKQWVTTYPIVSVEDGLAEDDWDHWPALCNALSGQSVASALCSPITLGDDFLCTNPSRIRRAIDGGACDALLLKVNQIGTLTEAAEALNLARANNWRVTISARSGETEDNWLADLAVGFGGDQIKIGSITQSERLAKYNRLLAIEQETGLPVVHWPSAHP